MTQTVDNSAADPTRLIVFEKDGQWAKLLRGILPDGGRWILETRSLLQLRSAAQQHSRSFILAIVDAKNLPKIVEVFSELTSRMPHCHLIAAAANDYDVGGWRQEKVVWQLREVGAIQWIASRRDVSIVRQLWQAHSKLYPPANPTIRERVFRTLPWDHV